MQYLVNKTPVFYAGKFKKPTIQELSREKSVVGCSIENARKLGGPILCAVLDQFEQTFDHILSVAAKHGLSASVDSRVHRLTEGLYPAAPGWHCHNVPMDIHTGQPNFSAVEERCFNVCCTLSSENMGVSNTEYVNKPFRFNIWDREHIYKDLHTQVVKQKVETVFAKDGQLVWSTPKTILRASPCVHRGWRMFVRLSMCPRPLLQNTVANIQQIYLLKEENGWQ